MCLYGYRSLYILIQIRLQSYVRILRNVRVICRRSSFFEVMLLVWIVGIELKITVRGPFIWLQGTFLQTKILTLFLVSIIWT